MIKLLYLSEDPAGGPAALSTQTQVNPEWMTFLIFLHKKVILHDTIIFVSSDGIHVNEMIMVMKDCASIIFQQILSLVSDQIDEEEINDVFLKCSPQ